MGRIAIFLATLTACGHGFDSRSDSQGIVGGTLSPGDSAVVALVAGDQQFCTGTIITPSVVITAAHCLPPNAPFALHEIEVFFGSDLSQGGQRVAIAAARAHPLWLPTGLANDVGIVELATPSNIEPIEMIADVGQLELIDTSVRTVGYGVTSDGGTENGVKRAGRMVVDDIDSSRIYLSPGPTLTCSGDSGGPVFADTSAGELIVGVHSRSDCVSTSLAERLDVHLVDFIGEFMSEVGSGASCSADGRCASGCGDPDPDCGDPVDASCGDGEPCDTDLVGAGCSASGRRGGLGRLFVAIALIALGCRRRRLS